MLLATVPNFSEGRDQSIIEELTSCYRAEGCHVADVHVDRDHNRTVITAFGQPAQVRAASAAAVECAVRRVDLRDHHGVHPRVGACDVLPIVPLRELHPLGATIADAIGTVEILAEQIGELGVPVLRYGEGTHVAWAGAYRLGGPDALAEELRQRQVVPEAGPAALHATAGAVIAGARPVLVAFNVVLEGASAQTARSIAHTIRERSGGLVGVRALGLELPEQGLVQVSTNIERWSQVGPIDVVNAIRALASEHDATVTCCELVGLMPERAWRNLAGDVPCEATEHPELEHHIQLALEQTGIDAP